jgi:predicted methyltransferase
MSLLKPFLTLCIAIAGAVSVGGTVNASTDALSVVLEQQPESVKARYPHRNPLETLEFFDIKPGMVVVEALPGSGWYSRLLSPYLGQQGVVIGAMYADDMLPLFGMFSDERLRELESWTDDWPVEARSWVPANSAQFDAMEFGSLPASMYDSADAVLFIRALHNLARFGDHRDYLSEALGDALMLLKPGGTLGVVQHRAPSQAAEDWSNGSNGYLKESFVIEAAQSAGFEFVDRSDHNSNKKDRPKEDDMVWRLPPTLAGSEGNSDHISEMLVIGESDRMTLKFRKPL